MTFVLQVCSVLVLPVSLAEDGEQTQDRAPSNKLRQLPDPPAPSQRVLCMGDSIYVLIVALGFKLKLFASRI